MDPALDVEARRMRVHRPETEPVEADLDRLVELARRGSGDLPSLRDWLERAEAWHITRALRACGGNRSAAARKLGIGRRTLYAKMKKLGIEPRWSAERPARLVEP